MSSELKQVCIQVYLKANSFIIFIYSEKATNVCENFTVDLSYVVLVKSTVEILQNFVAFSEYMNFKDVTTLSVLQGFCWAIITIIGTFKKMERHENVSFARLILLINTYVYSIANWFIKCNDILI